MYFVDDSFGLEHTHLHIPAWILFEVHQQRVERDDAMVEMPVGKDPRGLHWKFTRDLVGLSLRTADVHLIVELKVTFRRGCAGQKVTFNIFEQLDYRSTC